MAIVVFDYTKPVTPPVSSILCIKIFHVAMVNTNPTWYPSVADDNIKKNR
jgi:hypothetical protein